MAQDDAPLPVWITLLDDPQWSPLIAQASTIDAGDVAAVARLRREARPVLVQVALELARARQKARAKFPEEIARRLVADVAGVEMASSWDAARYKAQRIASVLGSNSDIRIHDFCCGIGGDAIALAGMGLDVCAVDVDPLRAWMAERNAGCESRCADVTSIDLHEVPVFHIDPARRSSESGSTRRAWRFADYEPGPPWIRELLARIPDGVIKLGPGIALEELPENDCEIEFLSESGRLTQAVVWSGRLQSPDTARRATLLPKRVSLTRATPGARTDIPIASAPEQFVYTFDSSVERARLLGELCAHVRLDALHPKVGLLTGADAVDSPWLTRYEFVEHMRWNEKRVKRWLHEHGAGIVEVKTRGRAVDPDVFQKRLRGKGDEPFVVFILRFGDEIQAIIARRQA